MYHFAKNRAVRRSALSLLLCCFALPIFAQPANRIGTNRSYNYGFQHQLLPNLFYRFPANVYSKLGNSGGSWLDGLYASYQMMADSTRKVKVKKKFVVEAIDVDSLNIFLVDMPDPKQPYDCFYVAFVFIKADSAQNLGVRAKHYFTHEKGMSFGGTTYNPVGSWTIDADQSSHQNYGPLEVNKAAFLSRIQEILSQRASASGGVRLPNKPERDDR